MSHAMLILNKEYEYIKDEFRILYIGIPSKFDVKGFILLYRFIGISQISCRELLKEIKSLERHENSFNL